MMAGFFHTADHGQLTIDIGDDTIELMTSAWRCINLMTAWSTTVRGSSLLVPLVAGRKSRARRVDELVVGLEVVVRGDVDPLGAAPTGGVWAQLASNIVTLSTIAVPPASGQVGHALALTLPNGDAYTAEGFVEGFATQPEAGTFSRVGFDLVIPAGTWTAVP